MDDLISRQAAILALVHEQSWNMHEDQRTAIGVIADLPPADAQRWIPCKEAMPPLDERVLICHMHTGWITTDVLDGDEEGLAWWDETNWVPDYTAWMPLPEPLAGAMPVKEE